MKKNIWEASQKSCNSVFSWKVQLAEIAYSGRKEHGLWNQAAWVQVLQHVGYVIADRFLTSLTSGFSLENVDKY